jgi:hypothetical protein
LFHLYVAKLPAAQEPIKLTLKAWDKLKEDERVWHQTVRRAIGIKHTPKTITIKPDHAAYDVILAMAMTQEEMVADYAGQNAQHIADLKARKLIATIAELLG